MTTLQNVHGHDIIELIHLANPPLTRAALQQEVGRRWGANVRFHTCSAESMTLDELLAFLLVRGKVVDKAGVLTPDMSRVCNHSDEPHAD